MTDECIVHWHGLHVPEAADGHPRYAVEGGRSYTYEFTVRNHAGTYWYHPHTHEKTAEQVYRGLAGMLLVSDDEEDSLNLPRGERDVPLVIQDRSFDGRGQFSYRSHMHDRMVGFFGERILVNGRPDFVLPVATQAYRLRLLNGSNSRIYKLAWGDGTPVTVIGTDGNFLDRPQQLPYVILAPAERVDLWLDCARRAVGSELELRSRRFTLPTPMGGGMMRRMGMARGRMGMHRGMGGGPMAQGDDFSVLKVRVVREGSGDERLPEKLAIIPKYAIEEAENWRQPRRIRLTVQHMSALLNGRSFHMTDAAAEETIPVDTMQLLEFDNGYGGSHGMRMPHPMHIHGQPFRVIKRAIDDGYRDAYASINEGLIDRGWKDTVLVMPGEKVTILKRFDTFEGLVLYHCHNLEHEDMGMMRNFLVRKG